MSTMPLPADTGWHALPAGAHVAASGVWEHLCCMARTRPLKEALDLGRCASRCTRCSQLGLGTAVLHGSYRATQGGTGSGAMWDRQSRKGHWCRHVKHTQSTQKAALASIKPQRRRDRSTPSSAEGPVSQADSAAQLAARMVHNASRAHAPASSLASMQVSSNFGM